MSRTWFDERGIAIAGGGHVPFLAGAMHYWRVEPRRWPHALRGLADLGVKLVESYVPWSVHEGDGGRVDWSGARDLGRFLDLAADAGLGVVLRPGPACNAELTGFGFPERVLRDEGMRARTASGGPVWLPAPPRAFPVPSYASAAFRQAVAGWYTAVAEVVAPRLAPAGPVVAIAVDNEAQHFFRGGAFDHDYHPDALALWTAEAEALGLSPEPPRAWAPDDALRAVAWVRARDRGLAGALGAFAASLNAAGLGDVARFHNLPPGEPIWMDPVGIARAIGGPVGADVYASRRDLDEVRRRGLHLTGTAEPLPIVPELGVGLFPWAPPLAPGDDARDLALTLLGAGVRGLSFYMAVARERWYGAALDGDGAPGPAARWLRTLCGALDEIGWVDLRRPADVAVVVPRADARFGLASSLLEPMTPVVSELLGLGPAGAAELGRDPAAIAARRWGAVVERALDLAGIPYVRVDEACPPDRLASFAAIIAPTGDRIDLGLVAALRQAIEQRRVVVIGPDTPTRDELGRLLPEGALPRRLGRMRAGSLDDVTGLADDLAAVAPPRERWRGGDARLAVDPLVDGRGQTRAVVLVNRADRERRVTVEDVDCAALRDPFSGQVVRCPDSTFSVAVPAHGARFLIAE